MRKVFCKIDPDKADALIEAFDGDGLALSCTHDISETRAAAEIYLEESSDINKARNALEKALLAIGAESDIQEGEVRDEDWRYSYRKHFKTERVGSRLILHPAWEEEVKEEGVVLTLDPGLAFGTGKHETTRHSLEFIDALSSEGGTFLDMGCGSGILSIAAALLGYRDVMGFDVDEDAVRVAKENAAMNNARVVYSCFELGREGEKQGARFFPDVQRDVVAANILGPVLVKCASEIASYCARHLIVSGILTSFYDEVRVAFERLGFSEEERKTTGEWTSGLLKRKS